MNKDTIFPYKEYVERALLGGFFTVTTLAQAKTIASETTMPCVIKLIAEFDGEYRCAFLAVAREAETKGIWVICGSAQFLESERTTEVTYT